MYVGGPTKIIRHSFGGSYYANRCCFGGIDYAGTMHGVASQGQGSLSLVRCSFGGLRSACVIPGAATQIYLAQNIFAGGEVAAAQFLGAVGLLYPNIFTHAAVGISAELGASLTLKYGSSAADVNKCALGLQWKDGSRIIGQPNFSGNTSDAQDAGNTLSIHGVWIKDTTLPLNIAGGDLTLSGAAALLGNLSISNNDPTITLADSASSALLRGDAGQLFLTSHSTARDVYIGHKGAPTQWTFDTSANEILLNGSRVLGTKRTGWTAATGTATRTTFDTASVTLPQLAERVKAILDDLLASGPFGA